MTSTLLTAAALLVPVRSLQQLAYVASLGLALLVMYAWGRHAARALLSIDDLGPGTATFLGQWALLAVAEVATTVNAAAGAWAGISLPLVPLVLVPSMVAVALLRRRRTRPAEDGDPSPRPLSLLALGSLAVVMAIYSRHLSALGLDTHQHLAWTRQILAEGYVPLVEPPTRILADYPRTFHLLTGLWSAAGLGLPPGPFVKVMPFLQAGLTALAASELLARLAASRSGRSSWRWELVLGAAGYVYAFLIVPTARLVPDLSGTPRYASTGILLLPVVLVLVAAAHRSAAAARLSLTVLPLVGAWGLTANPIMLFMLFAASLPMLAITWIALAPESPGARPWRWQAFAAPALLAALVLVRDPWVVSMAARGSPTVAHFLASRGVDTYDAAVRAGRASPRDKSFKNPAPRPACRALGCALPLAGEVLRGTIETSIHELRVGGGELVALARDPSLKRTETALVGALPIQPSNVYPHAALPLAILLLAGIVCAAWRVARRRTAPVGIPARLLLWWMLGVAVTALAVRFTGGMAIALSDGTHEQTILAGYLAGAGQPLFTGWLWIAFLLTAMVLYETLAPARSPNDGGPAIAPLGPRARRAAIAAALALPSLAILNLNAAWRNPPFMTDVGLGDLRALRRVERLIPEPDAVIVAAEHWNIGDWEHWVIPVGDTAALLPYGNRRYLFNVYLGASFGRSWHDLEERLCGPSAAERRRFLEENRARWLLLRDTAARSPDEAVVRARICEKPVATLFPELEPVRSDRGLFLFRIGTLR